MTKLRIILLTLFVALLPLFIGVMSESEGSGKTAYAFCTKIGEFPDPKTGQCESTGVDTNATYVNDQFTYFAKSIAVLGFAGGVLMIVFAAMMYTTSEGDPKKITMAKTFIVCAGVGMLISSSVEVLNAIYSHFHG